MKTDKLYSTHPNQKQKGFKGKAEFKILALPVDDGGCGWYRVRQLLRVIEQEGLADTFILTPKDLNETEIGQAIDSADVILARMGTAEFVKHIKSNWPEKKIIFDHDDNTFQTDPTNQAYVNLGVEDAYINDQPVWVTGQTPGFNKYVNRWSMLELMYLLQVADLNTGTTQKLTDKWAQYNGKAAIVPNGIDFEMYPDVEVHDRNKGDEIRIGWHGGVSHAGDIAEVAPSLVKILKNNPKAFYYTIGSEYNNFFEGVEDRIRMKEWLPFQAHPLRLKLLDLDIAVIPLEDTQFNEYKSEIKFSEFAALKIPILVKDMYPYNQYAKNGFNCLTYKTQEEFEKQLQLLIDSPKLRDLLVKNAYEWVKSERDERKIAKEAVELFQEVARE